MDTMIFDQHRLRKRIERYITYVRREFNVQKAILYGSYAYGTPREGSDVDLLVLSEDFAQMTKVLRHQRLGWLAWQAGTDYIRPIGFTRKEFEQASDLSLLGEIRERGIVVYDSDSPEAAS
jgi:hypothetical protein